MEWGRRGFRIKQYLTTRAAKVNWHFAKQHRHDRFCQTCFLLSTLPCLPVLSNTFFMTEMVDCIYFFHFKIMVKIKIVNFPVFKNAQHYSVKVQDWLSGN